ncbi:MAG TPA: tyrosine--tRNA ligase [Saprospiraceae bacterium]|nr:tyrosine--tRNA ligase [Saprospiraceae bacterium]
MDFIEELRWRNVLHDLTPGAIERLAAGPAKGYIGFDPTARSLTIGNYVQIMTLTRFQLAGHQPIVLMGGATGRIGDPSGKDEERELKSIEEIESNLEHQAKQMKKFLRFEGKNNAIMVNNYDFYKEMNVLEFLRVAGKTLTVNYMLSKDSVKNRLESGLSFTEFSYQILQAYDFQCLFQQLGCEFQMGGSDQWGNITSGTEFIRRNLSSKAFAVTTNLLTKSDGKKFGKSEKGNIWLDPEMTTPYQFYQFWINTDDADLPAFFRIFSLKSKEEIISIEAAYNGQPNFLKQKLADELTARVHSQESLEAARSVSELLFGKLADKNTLLNMSEGALQLVSNEIPSINIPPEKLVKGINIIDLLTEHTNILSSKGEARKALMNNAISINKEKITEFEHIIKSDSLLHHRYIMVENGKKNKYIIKI